MIVQVKKIPVGFDPQRIAFEVKYHTGKRAFLGEKKMLVLDIPDGNDEDIQKLREAEIIVERIPE
ncbi:MAG: hypothetical protein Q7K11_01350 [Candidatus Berkelbacteria bacterium]|nr:hypothetical protein [Candidatus Berkelbacteria bacterium]